MEDGLFHLRNSAGFWLVLSNCIQLHYLKFGQKSDCLLISVQGSWS